MLKKYVLRRKKKQLYLVFSFILIFVVSQMRRNCRSHVDTRISQVGPTSELILLGFGFLFFFDIYGIFKTEHSLVYLRLGFWDSVTLVFRFSIVLTLKFIISSSCVTSFLSSVFRRDFVLPWFVVVRGCKIKLCWEISLFDFIFTLCHWNCRVFARI